MIFIILSGYEQRHRKRRLSWKLWRGFYLLLCFIHYLISSWQPQILNYNCGNHNNNENEWHLLLVWTMLSPFLCSGDAGSVESPEQHNRRLTSKRVLEDTSLLSITILSVSPFPAILSQFPGPKCARGTYRRDKICVCLVEFHFTLHPQCLVFLSTSNDTLQCVQSVFSSWR